MCQYLPPTPIKSIKSNNLFYSRGVPRVLGIPRLGSTFTPRQKKAPGGFRLTILLSIDK